MRSGVMHQIRVHAKAAGIPLCGDTLYSGGEKLPFFPADFALHHIGLHVISGSADIKLALQPTAVPDWWPRWTKVDQTGYSQG